MSFNEFWAKYPRKRGKIAARKEYEKALKLTSHETIMAGLGRFIEAEPWRGDLQFCLWPERWLKKGCWEDEYPEEKAQESTWAERMPGGGRVYCQRRGWVSLDEYYGTEH